MLCQLRNAAVVLALLAHAGNVPVTDAQMATCNLGTLQAHLTSVATKCCTGPAKKACAKTGFPGANAPCSVECAKTLEPFWDSCSEILSALRMIPAGMPKFYDMCMATLYAPGKCGAECSLKTFHCKTMEINTACCGLKDNCPKNSVTPKTCPVGCSVVFPAFVESCASFLKISLMQNDGKGATKALQQYSAFADKCSDQHPAELIEYAHALIIQGCQLTLPTSAPTNGHDSRGNGHDTRNGHVVDTPLDLGGEPWV